MGYCVGVRNRVSSLNLDEDARIIAETRVIGLSAWVEKPGFFTQPRLRCKNYRRNPVSWTRRIDFLVELIQLYIHLDLRQKR